MARVLKPGGTLVVVDYKPEASHVLEFMTRHEEADFFKPSAVVKRLGVFGMAGKAFDFGVWYLVESKKAKPRPPPSAVRGGRARP